ncbi:hypothetical protein RDABS01_008159 [Bienertia sinuspersici]
MKNDRTRRNALLRYVESFSFLGCILFTR